MLAALVFLPVLAGSAAGVVAATAAVTPQEYTRQSLGKADLSVERADDSAGPVDPVALLPDGSRQASDGWTSIPLQSAAAQVPGQTRLVDLGDPITAGLYVSVQGRPARAAGEVSLSAALAQRLGVRVGSSVTSPALRSSLLVTGIVREAADATRVFAVLPPAATQGGAAAPQLSPLASVSARWLVALPNGTSPELSAQRLRDAGFRIVTRASLLARGAVLGAGRARNTATVIALTAVGLGEVALVIGAAFSMVARGQRRELGLLAAIGAGPRVRRRVVLAHGVAVGLVGTLAGCAAGVGVAALVAPTLAMRAGADWGPLRVPFGTLIPVAVAGILASLAAAALPARAVGRLSVTEALRDVDSAPGERRRTGWAGRAVLLCGVCVSGLGIVGRVTILLGIGALLLFVGGAQALVPLLQTASRAAGGLPVASRLAVRETARQPGRSAALASAIGGLVALTVVLAVAMSGFASRSDALYVPASPTAVAQVPGASPLSKAELAALTTALPMRRTAHYGYAQKAVAEHPGVLSQAFLLNPTLKCAAARGLLSGGDLDGCVEKTGFKVPLTQLAVAEAAAVEIVLGRPLTAAERGGLTGGQALVLNQALVQADGTVQVGSVPSVATGTVSYRIPALVVERSAAYVEVPLAFISPGTAAGYGLRDDGDGGTLLALSGRPSRAAEDRARLLLNQVSPIPRDLAVERGPQAGSLAGRLQVAVLLATLVTALVITVTAVGLAAGEMRTDVATFAAVGAPPRLRRRLTASHSLLVAVLGLGLGLAVGLVASGGFAYMQALPVGARSLSGLAAGLLALPVLAAGCGYLSAPRRLPLTRRAA